MDRLGLRLNETKTAIRTAHGEPFDFLGYSFASQHYQRTGRFYLGASPSKKSLKRLQVKVHKEDVKAFLRIQVAERAKAPIGMPSPPSLQST